MSEHDEENDDGEEILSLEPEDVQEILDWAVAAAAMITLMDHAPDHSNDEEAIERLDGYIQAIDIMIGNMPECLIGPAHSVAVEAVEDAEKEQVIVDEFLEQIKDL